MDRRVLLSLIVVVVIVLAGLAGWVASSALQRQQAEKKAAAQEAALSEQRQQQKTELASAFEDILNGLLNDVQAKAKLYKLERRVLNEMIQPMNLADPAYVVESYEIMQRTAPALRAKMDEIMLAFEQADAQIKTLLNDVQPVNAVGLLADWQAMNAKYVQTYITFFETEEALISAYGDLMEFYVTHKDAFSYDAASDSLVFADPALQAEAEALRGRIKDLSVQQAEALVEPPAADESDADADAAEAEQAAP